MTSDELFWRLVVATRTVDEAALLWRLAAMRADEHPYRISNRTVSRHLGDTVTRQTLDRIARRLAEAGLVTIRVLRNTYTEYRLDEEAVSRGFERMQLGQFEPPKSCVTVAQFDPFDSAQRFALSAATFASRLTMLLRSRDEALLLVWLHQIGAERNPIRISSRNLEVAMCGLIDRRTAMRSMDRLASAGLVSVAPFGHAGTEYSLDGPAVEALVHQPFPFHEDAAASMPGWASLNFPLLQRLTQALSAETTPAADNAAMEV